MIVDRLIFSLSMRNLLDLQPEVWCKIEIHDQSLQRLIMLNNVCIDVYENTDKQ